MYEWNPIYNLVMKIKSDYIKQFKSIDTYDLEEWINKLNKKEYNNFFECLQLNQFNEFVLIRYGMADMQESMWTNKDSLYRECRSVVIDLLRDELVLTPFRKFFNLNEVDENDSLIVQKEIDNAKSIEFTNKLDGSMQSARWYNDNIFMAGSMAMDINHSWRLKDGYDKLTENHKRMIKENPQYTFIFEYISLNDAHVVLYKKQDEGLYLIGIRNSLTGKQLSYNQIKGFANKYNVSMTKIENKNFNEILAEAKIKKSSEKEGWVINIDGHMIKLKCDDYIKLHRLLDKLSSINVIIQNIADNKYDDMIAKIPDTYKDRVLKIAKIIIGYIASTENLIKQCFDKAPKNDKKTFMIWVDTNCPKSIVGYIKALYLGQEYNVLKKRGNGYKKLKDLGIYENYSALFADLEE
jgi:hypothetical protein